MRYRNYEDVSHIIFSACDPDGYGNIPVSRLINYIDEEMENFYDRSHLQQLKTMLLVPLGIQELHIQKENFNNIVNDWIASVQDYKHSSSDDSEYDDCLTANVNIGNFLLPVSSENSSYTRKEQLADTEQQRNNFIDKNSEDLEPSHHFFHGVQNLIFRMCAANFILYGAKVFKLSMLLFFFWILFVVIYECTNGNCVCFSMLHNYFCIG